MIRRQVRRSDLVTDPNVIWNSFVDLLAMEDYQELSKLQRTAQLVFWYDAEVQNGGHLQYFLNSTGRFAIEAVEALSLLNLNCQKAILMDAISLVREQPLSLIETADEYVAEAMENKFGNFDEQYHECEPTAMDTLESYLEANQNEFVELV